MNVPGTKIAKPSVTVRDGNAYSIIAAVTLALKRAGVERAVIAEFTRDAKSGDYDHVMQTAMKYAEVE